MKTFTMRFAFGLAAAAIAAGGMLLTANTASADDEYCYEIWHIQKKKGTSELIVIHPAAWPAHQRHGDSSIENYEAECPVDEEVPV